MSHPLLNAFWMMLWFFVWIVWIMLLFRVIGDLFRDRELSGGAKAVWTIFLVLVPYLGVFVYLITRGGGMGAREIQQAEQQEQAFKDYVRETAAPAAGSSSDELAKLSDLKASGVLSEEEFQQAKHKVLA